MLALTVALLALFLLVAGCGTSSNSAATSAVTSPPATTQGPTGAGQGANHQSAARQAGAATSPSSAVKISPHDPAAFGSIDSFGAKASSVQSAPLIAAMHSYLDAVAASRWSTACARLAMPAQKSLKLLIAKTTEPNAACPTALAALLGRSDPALRRTAATVSVVSVRIGADRGFVLFNAPQMPYQLLQLLREGGAWKVASLAPTSVR